MFQNYPLGINSIPVEIYAGALGLVAVWIERKTKHSLWIYYKETEFGHVLMLMQES